jgi:hypothetical protein
MSKIFGRFVLAMQYSYWIFFVESGRNLPSGFNLQPSWQCYSVHTLRMVGAQRQPNLVLSQKHFPLHFVRYPKPLPLDLAGYMM